MTRSRRNTVESVLACHRFSQASAFSSWNEDDPIHLCPHRSPMACELSSAQARAQKATRRAERKAYRRVCTSRANRRAFDAGLLHKSEQALLVVSLPCKSCECSLLHESRSQTHDTVIEGVHESSPEKSLTFASAANVAQIVCRFLQGLESFHLRRCVRAVRCVFYPTLRGQADRAAELGFGRASLLSEVAVRPVHALKRPFQVRHVRGRLNTRPFTRRAERVVVGQVGVGFALCRPRSQQRHKVQQ